MQLNSWGASRAHADAVSTVGRAHGATAPHAWRSRQPACSRQRPQHVPTPRHSPSSSRVVAPAPTASRICASVVILFGLVGFLMRKFEYEPALLILALVMGPILEESLRRSIALSGGNLDIFLHRPIALGLFIFSFLLLALSPIIRLIRRRRAEIGTGGGIYQT